MLINWYTVIAQIINFLILVWLLKRFLYRPVMKAIQDREDKIATELKTASEKSMEAIKEQNTYQERISEFDQNRKEEWQKAMDSVNAERQQLLEGARKEAIDLRLKFQEKLKEEQNHLIRSINQDIKDEVLALTQKTLKELADTDLDDRILKNFLIRLSALDDPEKRNLKEAMLAAEGKIKISTSFELDALQKSLVETALKSMTENELNFEYQQSPKLIGGIEMNADGNKIAWSISEYLDEIGDNIQQKLTENTLNSTP